MSCYSFFFFFSSRRRHTRLVSDWSSDVCSSDLRPGARTAASRRGSPSPRSSSKPVPEIGRASCREKSVDLGGRRIIKKKKKKKKKKKSKKKHKKQKRKQQRKTEKH